MQRLALIAATGAVSCGLAQFACAFEYKGMPMAATEAAFTAKHPSFRCGASDNDYSDRECRQRGGTYANVPVRGTTASFEGNRLCSVLVFFTYDHMTTIKAALTEAYGAPTNTRKDSLPVSTDSGTNWVFTWRKGQDAIELRSFVVGFSSSLELKTDACLADRERLKAQRIKSRKKDM